VFVAFQLIISKQTRALSSINSLL